MAPERWQRVEQLYHSALALESNERGAFLESHCNEDRVLRMEVESLLGYESGAGSFMETPAFELAARQLAREQSNAHHADFPPGTQVGHFRVQGRLGSGGMGVVYLADDIALQRKVALKFLPALLTQDADALEYFRREARAASALNHPNICTIYEVGEHSGQPFIAMELLEGRPLNQLIAGKPLDTDRILAIGADVCEALSTAHARGIIHRDIKPVNIFVTTEGRAKILDFGLATHLERDSSTSGGGGLSTTGPANETGAPSGTYAYMSPEQVRGKKLDQRSDLFSFGATLYEMSTGALPFPGNTRAEIGNAILNCAPVPAIQLNPHLPQRLHELIEKCLEKAPGLRYQSAADIGADQRRLSRDSDPAAGNFVDRAADSRGPGTSATRPALAIAAVQGLKRHKLAAAGIALFAILLAAGLVREINSLQGRHTPPFRSLTMTKLTESGNASNASISPDGKYVLHAVSEYGLQGLWLRHVPTGSNTQVAPSIAEGYYGLTFSPDGNHIYFVRADKGTSGPGKLHRAPLLGGTPRMVIEDVDSAVSFSPDGARLTFLRYSRSGSHLIIANADGIGEKVLATQKDDWFWGRPDWSPDGTRIAVAGTTGGNARLLTVEVATGEIGTVGGKPQSIADAGVIWVPRWLPDGKGLVIVHGSIGAHHLNQISFVSYPSGEISRITNDLAMYDKVDLGMSADGKTLAAVQVERTFGLWVMPATTNATGHARQVGMGKDEGLQVSWLPDGRVLTRSTRDMFARNADGSNKVSIFAFARQADGNTRTNILAGIAGMRFPTVCGNDLITEQWRPGQALNLYRVNLNGGAAQQLTFAVATHPACSPDGKWVVYDSEITGGIFKIASKGGTPQKLSGHGSSYPTFSPDGKLIAFYYNDGKTDSSLTTIKVIPADGDAPVRTIVAKRRPFGYTKRLQFMPDGTGLLNTVDEGQKDNLWMQPLAGGPPTRITAFSTERIQDFGISPDGKQIAMLRGHEDKDVVLIKDERR